MARGFLSTSSEYLYYDGAPPADITALPMTVHIRFYSPASYGLNQWLFQYGDWSGADNFIGLQTRGSGSPGDMILWHRGNGGTSQLVISSNKYDLSAWNYITGAAVATNSRWVNVNGTKTTDTGTAAAADFTQFDRLTLGASRRNSTVSQYLDGNLAEFAVWNVELSDDEVASLNDGYSPLLIQPASRVTYMELVRSDNIDIASGQSYSTAGTPTTEDHPPVIQASSPFVVPLSSGGGGGGGPEHIWKRRTNHLRAWDVPPAVIEW